MLWSGPSRMHPKACIGQYIGLNTHFFVIILLLTSGFVMD